MNWPKKRIMNSGWLWVGLMVSVLNCNSHQELEVQSEQSTILPCNDRVYTKTESFKDVEGAVIERKFTETIPHDTLYYINAPTIAPSIAIWPCNLPDNAKKDGLKVKLSGHLVTYPGYELLNTEALPFELTTITIL